MALAQYSDTFWFPDGTLAANVPARVFLHTTNILAPLWTDATGTVPLANPITLTAGGVLAFWAEEGTYWLHLDTEAFEIAVGTGEQPASQQDITDAIDAHVAAVDPHGDRAYTDTELAAHVAAADPHGDRAYADALFLPMDEWRQRDLPDASLADSLYTGTAPSISTAQTTTPQAGFIKYAPPGVALTGTDVTGAFTFSGAGNFQIGAVSPDTNYVLPLSKYPNTYASGQGTWSVEFGTDAQTLQVRMKYISASTMFRLSIDGRKVTDLMQSSGGITPGSGHLITIDLGSATPRRFRFDFSTFPFGGVYISPTRRIWGVTLPGRRAAVLGDSISDGSSANTGAACGTWVDRYARLMNFADMWRQGRGGTGYITAGSFATFQNRLAGDITPWDIDELIIWGGYNDSAGSQAAIATAADLLYATIQTALPDCEIIVMGCWAPTGSPGSGQVNTNATLQAAALNAGLPFIDTQSGQVRNGAGTMVASQGAWITGTGNAGAPTGSGNADLYVSSDAVHPNDAGHVYLSRRVYAARTALMAP